MGHEVAGIKDKPSPPGFWHDPHIGPDGLVPMSSDLESRILSGLDGTNISDREITKAIWVDPSTGRLTPSTYSTTGSTPFQGSQMGFPPMPPKGSGLSVAGDMHGHNFPPGRRTGNEQPSGHDFFHGNHYRIPVGVKSPTGAKYIYRAHVYVDPMSSVKDGLLQAY